jgi:hypothetical protein
MSAKERLTAAIGPRIRAIAARFRRAAELKGVTRAECGQMVGDLDLSHPELDGVPSAGIVKEPVKNCEYAAAYLPIGPSCC